VIYYDEKELKRIIEAFYQVAGIKAGLYYINGQNFFTYPDSGLSPFCKIVRSDPETNQRCIDCDLLHMEECIKENAPMVYTCHLGLTEVIAPVKEDNTIIGFFMFGQFLIEESKKQTFLSIYDKVKGLSVDVDDSALKNAMEKIVCVTSSKLKALVIIFEALISQIISTNVIDYSNIKFISNLNLFIDSHISESISIKNIYEHLNISRNFLYIYAKKYLDCNINEYILSRKINHAKNLLVNTKIKIKDLPDKTGFSDYHYFARIFKKLTGVSPRSYRQSRQIIKTTPP
jgi:AraC-like DNA-binding protein/ligand-binding sensor protein